MVRRHCLHQSNQASSSFSSVLSLYLCHTLWNWSLYNIGLSLGKGYTSKQRAYEDQQRLLTIEHNRTDNQCASGTTCHDLTIALSGPERVFSEQLATVFFLRIRLPSRPALPPESLHVVPHHSRMDWWWGHLFRTLKTKRMQIEPITRKETSNFSCQNKPVWTLHTLASREHVRFRWSWRS